MVRSMGKKFGGRWTKTDEWMSCWPGLELSDEEDFGVMERGFW